jgi:CheY-like chemotaxis protein
MIFEMFSQEDSSNTRGYDGSGLGLTIAKGLVKLLGGGIKVNTEKGKGATFTFTIPHLVLSTPMKPSKIRRLELTDHNKMLVLIAEDEDSNYLYMEAVLKMIGYKSLHAINGAEAVAMCKQNDKINLVLMDIKMPIMNGIEATQLIREFKPELPIIATTAYAQTGDEQRFITAGCNGYLAKPVKKESLLALLNSYT